MREWLEAALDGFVREREKEEGIVLRWKTPLFAYSDAADERFLTLKSAVGPTHALPRDLLANAVTVVAYFIPFEEEIVKSNIQGRECSRMWAQAYIETNALISDMNRFVKDELACLGYGCSILPPTHNFDTVKLVSDWSHRHIAFICGLGTFGLNNMLITGQGCCGRLGSFVTDLKIDPTPHEKKENCLYKNSGICKKCVSRCVNDALHIDGFDRHKCYEMCLYNDSAHADLGLCDVCGKCLVNVPCSMKNPVKNLD